MENIPQSHAPVVLTIAGFDPSGGAGIIADIRTIEMFGCAGVATITSVTFQNAEKVLGAAHQPAESVRRQKLLGILESYRSDGSNPGTAEHFENFPECREVSRSRSPDRRIGAPADRVHYREN